MLTATVKPIPSCNTNKVASKLSTPAKIYTSVLLQRDSLFAEFEESDGQAETSESVARIKFGTSSSQVREMASKRDEIANQMWSDECASN
ncbi:hypothetical protein LINPERHAP1_LOCUS31698 [Linum perenne]